MRCYRSRFGTSRGGDGKTLSRLNSRMGALLPDRHHRHRSLSYRRRHTLARPVPNITRRKHAGDVGFQQEWIPVQLPLFPTVAFDHFGTSQDESPVVPGDVTIEPACTWLRSDEDEQGAGGNAGALIGDYVLDDNRFNMTFPSNFHHCGVERQMDIWRSLDLLDEIM